MKKIRFTLVSFFVILISACGPNATTVEVPPTQTPPPPTATTVPTATSIPATATPEFLQYYTEDFEKDTKYWPTFLVDGYNSVITTEETFQPEAKDGWLKFDLPRNGLWAYTIYDPVSYEDVRVDARVENLGTNNNNISLICRYSKENGWYEFNIANNGLYWIYHAIPREDGYVAYKFLEQGGSNKIKQGLDVNEYTIVCQGDTLTLFINDNLTKEFKNATLKSGNVGVSVSSFLDKPVTVNYDWVKISQP
jgi:hypothetical protein